MGDIIQDEIETVAPPKKKSLFNKEARASISEGAKAIEFFSRAKEVFAERLEEDKRKQEKKLARRERKRLPKSADIKEGSPVHSKKRRTSGQKEVRERPSTDEESCHEYDRESPAPRQRGTSHQSPDGNRYGESSSQGKSHNSPTRFSARYSRDLNSQKDAATRAKGCISLLDSDSDGEAEKKIMIPGGAAAPGAISLSDDDVICTSQRNIIQEDEDDEFQLSDEDFPELLQQAREQERAKDQQRLQAREAKEKDLDRKAMSDGFDDVFDTPKVNDDPIVEILITSKMEGTKPVMVKRKLSQRLKEAKFGWCDKQTDHGQTQEEFRGSVFLTWKKHKLHDMTTCRSLGVKVGEDGKPSYDAAGMDADGRIHLVAWTSKAYEIFLEREAEKEKREHARANGEEAQMNSGTKMKLILRPKNQEDFKLLVKPTTLISKLITAFSTARGIDEETTVSLYFDGDKLDPETSIAETELSDRDTVEVHIR